VDLLTKTIVLRPYVFLFLTAFLAASIVDLGRVRASLFGALAASVPWIAEFSSTRSGIPFGLYHYTATTQGQEIFIGNVPLMDPLSFAFLTYGAFCLARVVLAVRAPSRTALAVLSGTLMMLLDVVIDPLAVRGDRWFLGRVFYYPDGGAYFGVPLSNFAGWVLVGTAAVAIYCAVTGDEGVYRTPPRAGIALYYGVLTFNLAVTAWIEEWDLLGAGVAIHSVTALALWSLARTAGAPRPVATPPVRAAADVGYVSSPGRRRAGAL
jgi:putative membrane protein